MLPVDIRSVSVYIRTVCIAGRRLPHPKRLSLPVDLIPGIAATLALARARHASVVGGVATPRTITARSRRTPHASVNPYIQNYTPRFWRKTYLKFVWDFILQCGKRVEDR